MSDFPYPGLRPFHQDEVDIFFGRDEQIDQLLARLGQKRFLAVVGPSGCGKSSLVRTGLLNALETGFLASAGMRWRMATLRPGNQPLRNLARALLEKEALGPERGDDENSEAFLLATLRRGPLGLVEIRQEVTTLPRNTNLLVLVDQFEEIFRYRQQYDINEADAFIALLLASAAQSDVPIYVLIIMRSDFLGDCTLFAGLPETLNDSLFLIPRLKREQLQEAIIGPARVFGSEVEPALVNRLLNDMGTDPDQLPLMQHALMRLWNRASRHSPVLLTVRDYEDIGSLKEALSRHADEVYEQLDDAQKAITEILFGSLCERSATRRDTRRDTRRPARLKDVATVAGVMPEQVMAVVEVFRRPNRSFLMPPAGVPLSPDTIIDISHESLIRQWQKLSDWVTPYAILPDDFAKPKRSNYPWQRRFVKRILDIVGALVGILLFSPLMLITALAIKITSPGPVIFKQIRLGENGVPFAFYKFRTMFSNMDDRIHRDYISHFIRENLEEINQGDEKKPLYKLRPDPRITRVGRFIRETSIDELPQLFNVLKGEMSLVGPRPPLAYEVERYQSWHFRRLFGVKPGITGLWQVDARSVTSFDDMVRLDIQYNLNWSLMLDLKILIKTVKVVYRSLFRP